MIRALLCIPTHIYLCLMYVTIGGGSGRGLAPTYGHFALLYDRARQVCARDLKLGRGFCYIIYDRW
jgi:hypothetical protein